MVAFVLATAASQPWFGLKLAFDAKQAGAVVVSARGPAAAIPKGAVLTGIANQNDRLRFVADDFVAEPDGAMGTFANYETFLKRQGRLHAIQASPRAVFTDAKGGAWAVRPQPSRPLGSLPPDFWVGVIVGVVAWMISAWIWTFRPNEASTRYLLLSGLATLTFSPLAAIYSTRELALQADLFRWISDLNFFGGTLFGAALFCILLYYPRQLAPRWVGVAFTLFSVGWFAAQEMGAFTEMTFARRAHVLSCLGGSFVLSGVHWWQTRKDPIARSALQWFLLSWLTGIAIFCVVIFIPQILGVDTSGLQGYSFSLFLLIYGGLAVGLRRHRLFGLDEWAFRITFYAAAAVALLLLDGVLVAFLGLAQGQAIALSLAGIAFLYLPFRDLLWRRFVARKRLNEPEVFRAVLEIALAAEPAERAARWRRLQQDLFDPLEIAAADPTAEPQVEEDGLALRLPASADGPPLRLLYPFGGRGLFGPSHLAIAKEMLALVAQAEAGRAAYERGVREERGRIARDLHDDVGARLLSGLHAADADRTKTMLREALGDIRTIVGGLSAERTPLAEVLGDLRHETAQRLEDAGIGLDWPVENLALFDGAAFDYGAYRNFLSAHREVISNVIRHAEAKAVKVRIELADGWLTTLIEDDGKGLGPARDGSRGLANLTRRMAELGGAMTLVPAERGVAVQLVQPLRPQAV
jgi:signal transduction histidine kinase